MKITWFGDNVIRLYVGGQILVTDLTKAPAHIDANELAAGADVIVDVEDVLPDLTPFTADNWQRPRRKSMLEDDDAIAAPALFSFGGKALIADSVDESRLIVAFGPVEFDRFADDAVVISNDVEVVKSLLEAARPKLIALAISDMTDAQFEDLAAHSNGCAIQVLEKGFALEA